MTQFYLLGSAPDIYQLKMSTHTHGLKPDQKAKVASVSQDMEDNVFINEESRQKNMDTINKYMEEIQALDQKLEKIETTSTTKTEQQATERELRLKRHQIMVIVTDLSVKRQLDEFTTKDQAAKKTEETKQPTEIKIPVTELTQMKLDDAKKSDYYRNAVIAKAYKSNVRQVYDEIEQLMGIPSFHLTDKQRDEREITIKAKTETMKTMSNDYKKCNSQT